MELETVALVNAILEISWGRGQETLSPQLTWLSRAGSKFVLSQTIPYSEMPPTLHFKKKSQLYKWDNQSAHLHELQALPPLSILCNPLSVGFFRFHTHHLSLSFLIPCTHPFSFLQQMLRMEIAVLLG